jgi:CheY-like chemotaxis protein
MFDIEQRDRNSSYHSLTLACTPDVDQNNAKFCTFCQLISCLYVRYQTEFGPGRGLFCLHCQRASLMGDPLRQRGRMETRPHVLVISRDRMLLQTRKLILGAYFQVAAAGSAREAESLIAAQAFDLILLCYSLSQAECEQVADLIREHTPKPKILLLNAAGNRCLKEGFDEEFSLENGPSSLLRKSAEMLGFDLQNQQRLSPI